MAMTKERLTEFQRQRRERFLRLGMYDPNCDYCTTKLGPDCEGFVPPHAGSTGCRNGSIASGGDKAHCSCSACF